MKPKRSIFKRFILGVLFLPTLAISILAVSVILTGLRESKEPSQIAPGYGRMIQTRDAALFVSQQGAYDGPNVLLIHGTGAWGEIWRDTINVLASFNLDVMTVDIPPFGFSQKLEGADSYEMGKQADRLLDVLNTLDIKSTVVVCHSVGCRPALEAVLKKPEIAMRLVLVDPALGFADDRDHPHFTQKNPGAAVQAFLSAGVLRDAVTGLYGTGPWSIRPLFSSFVSNKESVTDERVAMLKQPLALRGMTRAAGDWMQNLMVSPENGLFTNFESYKDLQMPVLIVWGKDDTITPLWQGEALQKMFPHAELAVIPDCGHIPYIERVKPFNQLLLQFLMAK